MCNIYQSFCDKIQTFYQQLNWDEPHHHSVESAFSEGCNQLLLRVFLHDLWIEMCFSGLAGSRPLLASTKLHMQDKIREYLVIVFNCITSKALQSEPLCKGQGSRDHPVKTRWSTVQTTVAGQNVNLQVAVETRTKNQKCSMTYHSDWSKIWSAWPTTYEQQVFSSTGYHILITVLYLIYVLPVRKSSFCRVFGITFINICATLVGHLCAVSANTDPCKDWKPRF